MFGVWLFILIAECLVASFIESFRRPPVHRWLWPPHGSRSPFLPLMIFHHVVDEIGCKFFRQPPRHKTEEEVDDLLVACEVFRIFLDVDISLSLEEVPLLCLDEVLWFFDVGLLFGGDRWFDGG